MRKLQLLPGIEPLPQELESTTLTTAPIPLTKVFIALEFQKLRSEFVLTDFGIGTLAVKLDIRDFQVSWV